MGERTGIEWTDATWNPLRGCLRVSEGCRNCYAEQVAARFARAGMPYEGLVERGPNGARWTGEIKLVPALLAEPHSWKKPRLVFVNSMSDLFHEGVPNSFVLDVWDVMRESCNGYSARLGRHVTTHLFQVLTKRPERMRDFVLRLRFDSKDGGRGLYLADAPNAPGYRPVLPNVWLGVSIEDQATADERIPVLLETPAAKRFLSAEPLLELIRLDGVPHPASWERTVDDVSDVVDPIRHMEAHLDWVIVGGESGPSARPCNLEWVREVVQQCKSARVACFVKQLGSRPFKEGRRFALVDRKGGNPDEWPVDLRVREFPEVNVDE